MPTPRNFTSPFNAMSRRKSGQNSVEIFGYGRIRLEGLTCFVSNPISARDARKLAIGFEKWTRNPT
jgi:hypothetical protein